MKVLVASKNPVKIEAVRQAFAKYFPSFEAVGVEIESGLSHTPLDDEIYQGAETRARALQTYARQNHLVADYFVGLEGGMMKDHSRYFMSNRTCIIGSHDRMSYGSSGQYELPESISRRILAGEDLGTIIDSLTHEINSKQKGGASEMLSNGVLNRKELSMQAVLMALLPHVNEFYLLKK